MANIHYEVLVIGGGISGSALFYELAKYTDVKSIALIEKYDALSTLNSKGTSNSQTIHCGDIETNYTVEKATSVKRTAKMVEKYCLQHNYQDKFMFAHQKMAIGVGDDEVSFMKRRYKDFKELFPCLEVFEKEKLKEIEPKLIFDENAKKVENKQIDLFLNSEVTSIEKLGKTHVVKTKKDTFTTDFVVVNAGAHSLYLAHRMGNGTQYGCLPMAGSFYVTTKKILKGI